MGTARTIDWTRRGAASLVAAMAMTAVGCFAVVYEGPLYCETDCPDGLECIDGVCQPPGQAPAPTPNPANGSASRRRLTFLNPDGALSDFPVMVSLTPERVDLGAEQLWFTDSDGNLLVHEIESWTPSGAIVWVLVPAIDAGTSDFMWMYYGSDAGPPLPRSEALWSSYVGVWHLAESPDATTPSAFADATGSGHDAAADASMSSSSSIPGPLGSGVLIESSQTIVVEDTPELQLPTYSWEMWIAGDTPPIAGALDNEQPLFNADERFNFSWGHHSGDFSQAAAHRDATGWVSAKILSPLNANTWYYIAATYDGSELKMYLNGTLESAVAAGPPVAAEGPLAFGNDPNVRAFAGKLDEVRISSTARPPAYFRTQYRNMADSALDPFLAFGPVESP